MSGVSLGRRLSALVLLAVCASAGALFAFARFAEASLSSRVEQAQDLAQERAEALASLGEAPPRRRPRAPRAGWWDPSRGAPRLPPRAAECVQDVLERARSSGHGARGVCPLTRARPLEEASRDVGSLAVAAQPTPGGAVAWASVLVPALPREGPWRAGIAVLALATLALAALALHTWSLVRAGTGSLGRTLGALRRDLASEVERPRLTELASVAVHLEAMARSLAHAQGERDALARTVADQARLASLGRVVAGVAHEVRNPLASIKLKLDLARMAAAPAVREDLDAAGAELSRLDRLVSDLLVVSGRRRGPTRREDLGALALERAALLAASAGARGVTLEVHGEATAVVDRDAVTRALDNLLRNAIEASPEGGSVRVALASDGRWSSIAVEDRGLGVAPGDLPRLFEPFFSTRHGGTGLGLALTRAVAQAHGGSVRYERAEAVTRFVLRVPLEGPAVEA
ncbi:MAG: HAMP domain-containing histidine kinase [Deltaproteobacteria bacterium]|nr:HAMP domain-containing histidine kinase [Deltaproteobacteria bacterium]